MEDCGAPRGKGSFPAMITPAYQIAKRASELASDVSTCGHVVVLRRKPELSLDQEVKLAASFYMFARTRKYLSLTIVSHFPCDSDLLLQPEPHALDPHRQRAPRACIFTL